LPDPINPTDRVVYLNIGGTHRLMTNMSVLSQCKQSKLALQLEDPEELMVMKQSDGN
jgi:hypothetical protein